MIIRTAIVPLQDKILPSGAYSLRSEVEAIGYEYEDVDDSVFEEEMQAWSDMKRKVLEKREKVRPSYQSLSGG
jgi:hypothetical protein